ncbi:hypothetical protein ACJX0J_015232, partial [Zea mays]
VAEQYLRPTDPNFRSIHKRIHNDRKAYLHFKDCIRAIDGTHVRNVLAICDFDILWNMNVLYYGIANTMLEIIWIMENEMANSLQNA